MSKLTFTESTAPGTPSANKVVLYAKADGRLYFKADNGTEIAVRSLTSGDLLADGTVPLTTNWDVGPFKIIALQFESDATTGTAPLIVASTTLVANLNAALLGGTSLAGIQALIDAAVVGLYDHKGAYNASTNTPDLDTAPSGIKKGDAYTVSVAGTFYAVALEAGDVLIADQDNPTASTHWTIVNRNIDSSAFATAAQGATADAALPKAGGTMTGPIDFGGTDLTNAGVAFLTEQAAAEADIAGKGQIWVKTATPNELWFTDDAGTDVQLGVAGGGNEFNDDVFRVRDEGDTSKKIAFQASGIATATVRTITMPDEDVDFSWFKKYKGQNLQTGTTYTLALTDAGKIVEMNNGSANTLTIPANSSVAFPVDTRIDIVQYGAGQTTIAITTDTLRGNTKIPGQYKMVSLWKRTSTIWVLVGGSA